MKKFKVYESEMYENGRYEIFASDEIEQVIIFCENYFDNRTNDIYYLSVDFKNPRFKNIIDCYELERKEHIEDIKNDIEMLKKI